MAAASHTRRPDEKFIQAERRALFELLDRFPAQLRLDDLAGRVTRFKAEPGFGDMEEVRESVAELVGFGLVGQGRHGHGSQDQRQSGQKLLAIAHASIHFPLLKRRKPVAIPRRAFW